MHEQLPGKEQTINCPQKHHELQENTCALIPYTKTEHLGCCHLQLKLLQAKKAYNTHTRLKSAADTHQSHNVTTH